MGLSKRNEETPLDRLGAKVIELEENNARLASRVAGLELENAELREQLHD